MFELHLLPQTVTVFSETILIHWDACGIDIILCIKVYSMLSSNVIICTASATCWCSVLQNFSVLETTNDSLSKGRTQMHNNCHNNARNEWALSDLVRRQVDVVIAMNFCSLVIVIFMTFFIARINKYHENLCWCHQRYNILWWRCDGTVSDSFFLHRCSAHCSAPNNTLTKTT